MRYSIQRRGRIFVRGYGFLFFAKNIGRNIGKNIKGKYSQERLDHGKQSAKNELNIALKRAIQKTAQATGDLTGNNTAERISKVSKTSPENNSETVEGEIENTGFDKEISKERYVSPE